KLIGAFIIGVGLIGLIGGAFLVMRSRRRAAPQPMGGQDSPAAVQAAPSPLVQMSEDRRSWWDGSGWRDAEREVPPNAQRSGDGMFWWDGAAWRSVSGS
ncbi:MAG: hypothetical protein QOI23_1948, partial [Chloroflexota bacterium]|nr:hypothetical protein [Chloroflexota bacterium]